MATRFSSSARAALTAAFLLAFIQLQAQQPDQPAGSQPEKVTLADGIDRIAATEPSSRIQYVRLILKGSLHAAAKGVTDPAAPDPPPLLIAQCTLRPNGKHLFDIFASYGGPADLAFYPPWKSTGPQDLFPPRTDKVTITMDFLGYAHVKPFRRQWEIPAETPSLYRYNAPGAGSSNLEEFSYFLRYLMSLPTLRLTLDSRAIEFATTPLLADVRNESLCSAAGL
jgi:hypothetical protein